MEIKKELVVTASHRWTLVSIGYSDIHLWIKCLRIDYLSKVIEMEIYDDPTGKVFAWITEMILTPTQIELNHLDSAGKVICILTFSSVNLKGHFVEYNYAIAGELIHKMRIAYRNVSRLNKTES